MTLQFSTGKKPLEAFALSSSAVTTKKMKTNSEENVKVGTGWAAANDAAFLSLRSVIDTEICTVIHHHHHQLPLRLTEGSEMPMSVGEGKAIGCRRLHAAGSAALVPARA